MKANELRLGNYLKWDNASFRDYCFIVTDIGISGVNKHNNHFRSFDELIGIELDENWLTKLGLNLRLIDKGDGIKQKFWHTPYFGRHNEHYLELQIANDNSLKSNFLWLNWNIGGGNYFIYLPKKVKYVHELQNLFFALTGEELIIK